MGELAGLDSSGASRGRAVACAVCFRPCIIHKGKVKQIVGSTLRDASDDGTALVTNFESDKCPAEFANIYKEDGLVGGHVIMLGGDPASRYAALEALLLFLPYSSASSFSYQTTSLLLQCLAGGARGLQHRARATPRLHRRRTLTLWRGEPPPFHCAGRPDCSSRWCFPHRACASPW